MTILYLISMFLAMARFIVYKYKGIKISELHPETMKKAAEFRRRGRRLLKEPPK